MPHVTIPGTDPRAGYTAASGQQVFPIPFPFFSTSDIKAEVNQSAVAGFTVTGVAVDGGFAFGTLTFSTPRTAGDFVLIYRSVPVLRVTDFPYPSTTLDIQSLNTEFDRITAILQEQATNLGLCLRVPIGGSGIPALPSATGRANRYLAFDGSGNPVATTSIPDFDVLLDGVEASAAAAAASAIVAGDAETGAVVAQNAAASSALSASLDRAASEEAAGLAAPLLASAMAFVSILGTAIEPEATTTFAAFIAGSDDLGDLAGYSGPFRDEQFADDIINLARDNGGVIDLGDFA
jgi:hypothetical protein